MARLTNVVYTDFEAIDDNLDNGWGSILDPDNDFPHPIIVERVETSFINTSRIAMLERHKAWQEQQAYWENEQYTMAPQYRERYQPNLQQFLEDN